MKFVFLFIDGVGVREPAPDNPVNPEVCPAFCRLIQRHGIPIDANLNTELKDASFVKGFVPKESRSAFNIPKNMKVGGDVSIKDNKLIADVVAKTKQGNVNAKVNYGMNDDSYNIDMYAENLNVNQFVPLDEPLNLSGKVKAKGKSFDFFNKKTTADVDLDLKKANYGQIDLSNTDANLQLKNE